MGHHRSYQLAAIGLLLLAVSQVPVHAKSFHGFAKRVIGGEPVRPGDSPFLVSLQVRDAQLRKSTHICGASVISDRFVLTAAHCVNDLKNEPEKLKVYLGTLRSSPQQQSHENHTHSEDSEDFRLKAEQMVDDILEGREVTDEESQQASGIDPLSDRKRQLSDNADGSADNSTAQNFEMELEMCVEKILVHDDFPRGEDLANDIAILMLAMPIPEKYQRTVVSVSLPTFAMETEGYPAAGSNCTVFGWGLSHVPQKDGEWLQEDVETSALRVDVEVREIRTCAFFYKYITGKAVTYYKGKENFCAGNIGTQSHSGAFSGDSGGPLLCAYDGTYYQAGIVSFGSYRIGAYIPAFFTRVTAYEEWIKNAIESMM